MVISLIFFSFSVQSLDVRQTHLVMSSRNIHEVEGASGKDYSLTTVLLFATISRASAQVTQRRRPPKKNMSSGLSMVHLCKG